MTQNIIDLLMAERARIDAALTALQGERRRRGRPPGSVNKAVPAQAAVTPITNGSKMTSASRKAQSRRMKAYWAAKRANGKAAKKSA